MTAVFSAQAEGALEAIGDYIAIHNPRSAAALVRALRLQCQVLAEMPQRYPLLPGHEISAIRRCVHGNYLIFYKVEGDAVLILHILHGAMDFEPILFPGG